jgi:hypothetical protein
MVVAVAIGVASSAIEMAQMRAAVSGLSVSIKIIRPLILAPREDIMYSMQLLEKETHYCLIVGNRGVA